MKIGSPRRFLVLAASALMLAGCVEPQRLERRGEVAGRPLELELWALGADEATTLAGEIEAALGGFMAKIDADDPGSPLGVINAVAGTEPQRVGDRDVYRCVLLALDWARASRGAYDPISAPTGADPAPDGVGWGDVVVMEEARAIRFRRPAMRLDLTTIGTGFALDVAARRFSMTGSIAGLMRYDATWYGWGSPPGATGWTVPLVDTESLSLGELDIAPGRAVSRAVRGASTGDGGRIAMAVAVADSGGDAAAIAASLRAAGVGRAGGLLERSRRVEAVLFVEDDDDPRILASASLRGRLRLPDEVVAGYPGGVRFILAPTPD